VLVVVVVVVVVVVIVLLHSLLSLPQMYCLTIENIDVYDAWASIDVINDICDVTGIRIEFQMCIIVPINSNMSNMMYVVIMVEYIVLFQNNWLKN